MKPNLGISENHLKELSLMLNKLLADEHVLYIKTHNYHWNVGGQNFSELHQFFEEQYTQLHEIIDGIAERVRQLGHYTVGSLKDFLALTSLTEGQEARNWREMIFNLLNDHESIIHILRHHIPVSTEMHRDIGTADFMTQLLQKHEKMAWMLRSYLS